MISTFPAPPKRPDMHKGAHYIDKLVLATACLSYGMAAFSLAFQAPYEGNQSKA